MCVKFRIFTEIDFFESGADFCSIYLSIYLSLSLLMLSQLPERVVCSDKYYDKNVDFHRCPKFDIKLLGCYEASFLIVDF